MESARYASDIFRDAETKAGHRLQMREHDRLAFNLSEYQRRYDAVLANMTYVGVEMLLVRSPENICYLTGLETPSFCGYQYLIFVPQRGPVLIVMRIEEINATEFSWLTQTVQVAGSQPPFEKSSALGEATNASVSKRAWVTTARSTNCAACSLVLSNTRH